MHEADLACGMRVRIDAHHAAEVERRLVPAPIKIETPRIGIDLDCNAMSSAGREHTRDVDIVSGSPQQLPSRHMAEDGCAGIHHCANNALRLRPAVEAKAAVDARDDKIEACKHLVRIVKRAIGQNIALDAFEDAKAALVFAVQAVNLGMLGGDLVNAEPAGLVCRSGMIGDPEILIAPGTCRFRHCFQSVDAIGEIGMGVKDPADVSISH
jgi:hypothetical protein